tara:strand:+ start:62 stop:271 length:210 start_codon:yes stop_codon:yes gene_type:complete
MVEEKKKLTRTARPVFAVMSIKDVDGNPIKVYKEQVTVHSVHKDAEELLELVESGTLPTNSFYVRIKMS